jgi:hypothetical protein
MAPVSDLRARHAWRGAFVACLLNAAGMPVDLFLSRHVPGMPWYPPVLSALSGVGLSAWLLTRRHGATVRLGSTAFFVNNAVILVALWITSGYWASTPNWTPFQANKLGALTVALIAPELGVGLLSIAGFAGTAIAKFYTFDPEIQRRLPVGEPWFMLIFAFFAVVLLLYRLRSLTFEREVLYMHAETAAAEQVARTFLHLRDSANTPIQTIVVATELLRSRNPDLPRVLATLDRAAKRLTEFSTALTRYEAMHKWSAGDESPDESASAHRSRVH